MCGVYVSASLVHVRKACEAWGMYHSSSKCAVGGWVPRFSNWVPRFSNYIGDPHSEKHTRPRPNRPCAMARRLYAHV